MRREDPRVVDKRNKNSLKEFKRRAGALPETSSTVGKQPPPARPAERVATLAGAIVRTRK